MLCHLSLHGESLSCSRDDLVTSTIEAEAPDVGDRIQLDQGEHECDRPLTIRAGRDHRLDLSLIQIMAG